MEIKSVNNIEFTSKIQLQRKLKFKNKLPKFTLGELPPEDSCRAMILKSKQQQKKCTNLLTPFFEGINRIFSSLG